MSHQNHWQRFVRGGKCQPCLKLSHARRLRVEELEDRRLLAVLSVSSLADSGQGSLREAITMANGTAEADTINIVVAGTIQLATQLPNISQPLTINGRGADQTTADQTTIDAGGGATTDPGDGFRIFTILNNSTPGDIEVEISGLTLTGGDPSSNGGGAILNRENLTVFEVTITGNTAPRGGGIENSSQLGVISSTIAGNEAYDGNGGGINAPGGMVSIHTSTLSGNTTSRRGGGVYLGSFVPGTMTNSTVSGNTAAMSGGGIASFNDLTVTNSTVVRNAAESDGGIGTRIGRQTHLISSIVADNTATLLDPDVFVSFLTTNENNLIGVDPLLGPLTDNGGPTKTHALLPGSPALDAGSLDIPMPVHVYELEGSLTDENGGPALASLGGTLVDGGYDFAAGEGLSLSSANISPGEYALELDFSFDAYGETLSFFQKIVDFKDLTSDNGLYARSQGLNFFGVGTPGNGPVNTLCPGTLHQLILTRDDETDFLQASIDGEIAFSLFDRNELAVFSETDQIIRFFEDDVVTTNFMEEEAGFVERIRIFDTAFTLSDQRGALFNRVAGNAPDVGAYEAQITPSADFDGDLDVDGADFLAWQRGFGTTNAQRPDGDSDADTDVDASDLAAWQVSYGQPQPLAVTNNNGQAPALATSTNVALFEAAMAWELAHLTSEDETSIAEASTTEATTEQVFADSHFTPTHADDVSKTMTSGENEPLASETSWLEDELLNRVFG